MFFGGNCHSPRVFFKNNTRGFEGKGVLLFNTSPTRFAIHFLRMMCTLYLKYSLRGTVNLQEFIALELI